MSDNLISRQIEEYIGYKRALGYQLKIESEELKRFAAYTIAVGHEGSLTTDIAFKWATLKPEYSRWYMARRMETICTFAKYICVFDSNAQQPPKRMFGKCHGRTTPYIFSEEEIGILIKAASTLHSVDGLRSRSVQTALGLLWATGMRPNEACQLLDEDINWHDGSLTIKETKFSKSRTLPLHETVILELKSYATIRDRLRQDFSDRHFLITTGSHKLILRNLEYAMQVLRKSLLAEAASWSRRPPRLYDIRHSFACKTLQNWLESGIDVNSKIIYLSTYLGHVKVADTFWYLSGTPELLRFASESFESFFFEKGGESDEAK